MADERLRLVAEVTDQFSGPLSKMETALRRTASSAKQVASDAQKDWGGFSGALQKSRTALEGISPALAAVGVGSLGAGLAVSGVVNALRGFATSTRDVSLLSKEVGLATNELRAFGRVGEDFGVSAQTMQGGVKNFSEQMSQLRKRYGETYASLQAMNLGDLVEKLVAAPNMKVALDAAMDALGNIGDPTRRRKVASMLFGVDQMGIVASELRGKFRQTMDETINDIGRLDPAMEKAAGDFEKHIGRIGDAAERAKIKIFGPFLKGAVGLIDDIDKNGLAGNADEQALRRQLSPLGGPAATDQQRLEGRRNSIQQQMRLLESNPSAPDYQRKHDRMVEELKRVADELEKLRNQGATVQQQSFTGGTTGGGGGLIQKASFGGGGGFGAGGFGGFGGPMPTLGGGFGGLGGGRSGGYGRSSSAGQDGVDVDTPTPRGSGVGNARAARTGQMMSYAIDQLRREGVPESQLRTAAAHLVGQATMESGLDPNKTHDQGTGYGIYGARLGRRTKMLNWLQKNGYAPNSAEGQMRYMTHEAMTGGYQQTRRILMGEGSGDITRDTNAITGEFESPKIINHRAGAVRNALRIGGEDVAGGTSAGTGMSQLKDTDIEVPGSGRRTGDAMMRRLYGDAAPSAAGSKGSLHIQFDNAPAGLRPRASMDDLFKEVTISKSRQMDMQSI